MYVLRRAGARPCRRAAPDVRSLQQAMPLLFHALLHHSCFARPGGRGTQASRNGGRPFVLSQATVHQSASVPHATTMPNWRFLYATLCVRHVLYNASTAHFIGSHFCQKGRAFFYLGMRILPLRNCCPHFQAGLQPQTRPWTEAPMGGRLHFSAPHRCPPCCMNLLHELVTASINGCGADSDAWV